MQQTIGNKSVYVVDFDTMPEMPITGLTEAEAAYELALSIARGFVNPIFDPDYTKIGRTAKSLTDAIETGVITEPGKYGIYLVPGTTNYEVYTIQE